MKDLTAYMNAAIDRMVKNALILSVKNPRELLFLKRFSDSAIYSAERRKQSETKGVHIPPFLIASIASSCNLKCAGCYAHANALCGDLSKGQPLSAERWGELFCEAKNLGISFILLAGGEPLMRKDVLEEAATVQEILFPVFTNGTIFDESYAQFFDHHRNLLPVFSVEGGREQTDQRRGKGVYSQIQSAMALLKRKSIFFGASLTITKENLSEITDEFFVKELYSSGCKTVFFVEYVPVDGRIELALNEADRLTLENRLSVLRETCPMLLLSFPGDEKALGGCLAAGRGFFHINPYGGAEPCPFSPFSDVNVRESSLTSALSSPLFQKLSAEEFLKIQHTGGCTLFEKRSSVANILK